MDDSSTESGTPKARLTYLLAELARRFPDAVNPLSSQLPETKYLAAIDRLIEKSRTIEYS